MPEVLGVDGCPHGWCAIALDTTSGELTPRHHHTFAEVIATKAKVIAIDVPIGLLEEAGSRDCDREARALLGAPRASSVFPPPVRQVLKLCGVQDGHPAATSLNASISGKGISIQSYWIGPKIREVDDLMWPARERRVREAHPEVSFAALAGKPMKYRKARSSGRRERWNLLRDLFPQLGPEPEKPSQLRGICDLEDYIDALVCAWTANRIFEGDVDSLPGSPPRDPKGLRMAIWRPRR